MALLTFDEASEKVRLAKSTLYKLTSARRVPFIKLGAKVLFDESELDAWISARRVSETHIEMGQR